MLPNSIPKQKKHNIHQLFVKTHLIRQPQSKSRGVQTRSGANKAKLNH